MGIWGSIDAQHRSIVTVVVLVLSILITLITSVILKCFVKIDEKIMHQHGYYVS